MGQLAWLVTIPAKLVLSQPQIVLPAISCIIDSNQPTPVLVFRAILMQE